jgi:hypothetical protein
MSIVGLGTAVTLVDAAGRILASDTVKSGVEWGGKARKFGAKVNSIGGSIASLTKQTTIMSRVFIDESLTDEIVIPNLMKSIHEWYSAQIVAALHLSKFVDDFRTVQDVMGLIQTGHNAPQTNAITNVRDRLVGLESIAQESFTADLDALGLEAFYGPLPEETKDSKQWASFEKAQQAAQTNLPEPTSDVQHQETVAIKSVKVGDNKIGPLGELYEIKMAHPRDPKVQITVPFYIQMQPSIIPMSVAPRFIDMNVVPSLWQRWTQMNAGEIHWFKDFILMRDHMNRGMSIIKNPEMDKAFSDFRKTLLKKDMYALSDVTAKAGSPSSNLANSVVMFSEDTVAQAKSDSGIDLHNAGDRHRYFRDTYTMIIVVVDTVHQRVTVYFNGIDGDINVPYSDFRPKDSKFDPNDFMTALQAFSTNSVGRLR